MAALAACLSAGALSLAADAPAPGVAVAPLSIPAMLSRRFDAALDVVEAFGEFDGYRSYAVRWESDGLTQSAVMNVPAVPAPERGFPVVIMNHGNANNRWESFRAYYSRDQESVDYLALPFTPLITRYAREGFVVLLPDYRGHGFSETRGRHAGFWQLDRDGNRILDREGEPIPRSMDDDGLRFGGWLYTAYYTIDVLHLVAALENVRHPPSGFGVDLDNRFLWGRSLGGDVAARAMTVSDRVRAASLWVPATTSLWDQAHHYHYDSPCCADGFSLEALLVELRKYQVSHGAALKTRDLDPANFADRVDGPVLIQVSIDDTGVRSAWGIQYHYALLEHGVPSALRIYPGDAHVFAGDVLEKAIQADLAFFRAAMAGPTGH